MMDVIRMFTNKLFSSLKMQNLDYELIGSFQIPEQTRSLLWVTDEDVSKITGPLSIRFSIDLNKKSVKAVDTSYNFFSEPSLIWAKLPIEPNNDTTTDKMYYPSYHALYPQNRYQYLSWLCDITKKTNQSYVFLYFYGLERHLLLGKYDEAVDEILRLLQFHDEYSFRNYAINSLIAASGFRKRPDIVLKAPFLLEQTGNESLLLARSAGKTIRPEQIIKLANRVGFTNKRYIKEEPVLFSKELLKVINDYEKGNGNILRNVNINLLPKKPYPIIANTSIPPKIRTFKLPQIAEGDSFREVLKTLLTKTHKNVKELLKSNPGYKIGRKAI